MKLPGLLKRDPSAALNKEVADSATAAAKLASMRAAREAVLLDTDLSKIIELDAAIATAERVCTIHQSRIAAFNAELRKERQAERQQLKEAAIAALEPGLAAHIASAGKLEAALINLKEALERHEETAGGWCDEKPPMDVYSELLARTSASDGHIIVSFTPIGSSGAEGVPLDMDQLLLWPMKPGAPYPKW
jgi:hypothetical protein